MSILPPPQTPRASGHMQHTQNMPLEHWALVAGWIVSEPVVLKQREISRDSQVPVQD